ncbi:M28 family metallopeptidase [Croceiramulus getboli]|nr:M28 family metallopeptidase [Flavobacteriaceae bacterium YJPT1-3]
MKFAKQIDVPDLTALLYTYASDEFEGRNTGTPGQRKAAAFLKDYYQDLGIPPAQGDNYYQSIPKSFFNENSGIEGSENVVAVLKGSEKPEEYIVISAHLDHVGVNKDGEVYNGADDDGSGTVAILEIAEAFKKASDAGYPPKRSIAFLHVTGEERGLYGSKYYVENPIFPLANTVADLNIDMIGRQDEAHKEDDNYVYLIGSDKLSEELHNISATVNEKYTKLNLDYRYNDVNDPNRFYYRSDHYNFAKNNIPVIFYFNGVHEDYHKITDTPDKINYPLLAKRAQLVFVTAWELANRKERIKLDQPQEEFKD